MDFIVNNENMTMELGRKLGLLANAGDIICINGELGTGKTHFTKGFAKGLSISENITSPTFNIVNEYNGRLKLNHFDVYRVNDPEEIYAIGFDDYVFSDAVSIIEWSSYIAELIPTENISVYIEKFPEKGVDFRKIVINYIGDRYNYVEELKL